jgi:hypothetical protein
MSCIDRRIQSLHVIASDQTACRDCGVVLTSVRIGTGCKADGMFCSLRCISHFYIQHWSERAKHRVNLN